MAFRLLDHTTRPGDAADEGDLFTTAREAWADAALRTLRDQTTLPLDRRTLDATDLLAAHGPGTIAGWTVTPYLTTAARPLGRDQATTIGDVGGPVGIYLGRGPAHLDAAHTAALHTALKTALDTTTDDCVRLGAYIVTDSTSPNGLPARSDVTGLVHSVQATTVTFVDGAHLALSDIRAALIS